MSRDVRIAYQPALDGVRAMAVIAVLLFHAATPGFDGGYLGVSVFFTLSGYLITSLLLREHAATGRIDVGGFYSRRLRRLLPASVVTLALIVLVAGVTDEFDAVDALRAQVLGALFQVANWVFLAGDSSYQELLADNAGTPSPVEHFWSLAIEEQFYWAWPLVTLAVLSRTRTRRHRLVAFGTITAASAAAAPAIAAVWGPDAAYWATPARLSEILIGAMLAVVIDGRTLDRRFGVLAPVAIVALGAAVVLFPAASGPAYEGWLPLVAVGSGALLTGLQVQSPLTHALSWRPLVWLGRISYGVYLYHWPVYVLLDADRLGTGGASLTVLRLAVTLAVATASFYVVEQPVRRLRRPTLLPTLGTSAAAMAAVAVAAVLTVPAAVGEYWKVDDEVADAASIRIEDDTALALIEPTSTSVTTTSPPVTTIAAEAIPAPAGSATTTTTTIEQPVSTPATLPPLARPVRIVLTGDSTAEALGAGVIAWAAANPSLAQVEVEAAPGCGFVSGGERRRGDGVESDACEGWIESQLVPVVERAKPDVVAVMVTTWDVIGRRWTTDELLAPYHPEYRRHVEEAYGRVVDELLAAGAPRVVLIRQPVPDVWWLPVVQEEDEPQRHAVIYDTYEELMATHPDNVTVVEFDRWFSEQGFDGDRLIRPDGVHLAPDAAQQVMADFLGERLIRSALGMAPA
jgi:peptidoglycan/LPS O-acetylase OafA/YrhL